MNTETEIVAWWKIDPDAWTQREIDAYAAYLDEVDAAAADLEEAMMREVPESDL